MRGLKILVVVMGVMLIGGVAILVVAIAMRASQTRLPVTPFTAPPLELPAGSRVEAMTMGADRLVVAAVLPDGSRQLIILDLNSGRQLGRIPLRGSPCRYWVD